MAVVSWAVWGLFVGVIARLLLPGRHRLGLMLTVVLGICGSLLGGVIATQWLHIANTASFDFGSFLIAVLTSVLLLGLVERIDRLLPDRRRRERLPH
ncbi:MAG: GlsB/YeaQ/YmgE family stress response membrane protein [Catenulispora sp.]